MFLFSLQGRTCGDRDSNLSLGPAVDAKRGDAASLVLICVLKLISIKFQLAVDVISNGRIVRTSLQGNAEKRDVNPIRTAL